MESFEVIKRNGQRILLQTREPFCAVTQAVQNTSLMGDDNVQLSFVSSEVIDLVKGDKIVVFGEEYTIRTKVAREMISNSHYTYEATFYGVMYELMKTQYRNTDAYGKSTKSTFDLTYSIKDFVKVLIYNVERDYPGVWVFDEANCPDTEPLTLQFSKQNCLQVLQTLCSEDNFNLEFRITQNNGVRTIHIGKFGAKVVPPAGNDYFEWGKGHGLYKLKEDKVDDKAVITRLWVEGGTTNIRSGYRGYSERLQLPFPSRLNKKEHTLSDGTVIPAKTQVIGLEDDTKRYFEDAELRDMLGSDEDSKDYDDIYPTRKGEVTAIFEGDVNSFVDDSMDFDLCEKDANGTKYLIAGTSAKINFITGRLAGQQFELVADSGYNHQEKKFKIIPYTDERGLTIPTTGENEAYRIEVGNKYKITDINLPDSYVEDAEERLWYAGLDDFNKMKQARAQYQLTLDRKYFVDNLPNDSDTAVFKVGDYVPVRDARFGIEKNIRIQQVSRNLLLKHDYNLTLSDVTAISVFSQTVVEVMKHNQIIQNNRLKDLNKAKRGWRTTEELRNMVYDTDGYFDSENIRPNSIDTNMLTVGSKSQQFVLVDVILEANVNGNGDRLNASAGILAHLSINEDDVKKWNMGASEFTMGDSGGYYLFAKCSKSGNSGVWFLTQEQFKFEPTEDPNNYYFQVGIVSSLYKDGFRDFVTTYGFTRINGNTITTGKIVTSDGECYLDLDGNQFRIGDATSSMDWGVTAKGQLTLKNVKLLSTSGDVAAIGVFRGTYNANYIYYTGDEVTYTNNGETCTYRYINNNASKGQLPTNSVYWAVVAQGAAGADGAAGAKGDKGDTGATGAKGDKGDKGDDGVTMYTWIRYADDDKGTNISNSPTGKTYIGFAYNKTTPTESNTPSDYTWSHIKGEQGVQGAPGTSFYTWIKYANVENPTASQMFDTPDAFTMYIGIAVNQTTATESTDPSKYTWSKFRGDQGVKGDKGDTGTAGDFVEYRYAVNGSSSTAPTLSTTTRNPGGWSTTQPNVSTLQYLWMTFAKVSGATNNLISAWSTPVRVTPTDGVGYNPNLLRGADFRDMSHWDMYEGSRYPNALDGYQGWKTQRLESEVLTYVLRTKLFKEDVACLVSPSTWYTLSFWAKREYERLDVNITGNGYPMSNASKKVRFEKGVTYTIRANGCVTSTALAAGKNLRVYIYNSDWSFTKIITITETSLTTKSITFSDAPTTGEYTISAYLYDKERPSGVDVGTATVVYYQIERLGKLNTYITSAIVDTNSDFIVDGSVESSTPSDGAVEWNLTSDWVRHTVTFKTAASYAGTQHLVFCCNLRSDVTYICMPKLERGKEASAFGLSEEDKKGDSPALVYRGDYNAGDTYYGSSVRVDAVKYGGVYYVARVDAGAFSGQIPTNMDYWNTFGAQLETVATQLVLAENANLAGWVFRNNRLESQDGSVFMDGVSGEIRLKGTLQLGTRYALNDTTTQGSVFDEASVYYLPPLTSIKQISPLNGKDNLGKVLKIYNSGEPGTHKAYSFRKSGFINCDDGSGTTLVLGEFDYIYPGEVVELTCFERQYEKPYSTASETGVSGVWMITGRYGREEWRNNDLQGRYPRVIAMGKINCKNETSYSLSGYWYNGKNINDMLTINREGAGYLKLTLKSGSFPEDYMVFATGIGTGYMKPTILSTYSTYFYVYISDDSTPNDGSCCFMIMSPQWWYGE